VPKKKRKNTRRRSKKITAERKKISRKNQKRIILVIVTLLGLLLLLGIFGAAGSVGNRLHELNYKIFGFAFFFTPLVLLSIPAKRLVSKILNPDKKEIIFFMVFVVSVLVLIELLFSGRGYGGVIGTTLATPTERLFGAILSSVVSGAVALISLFIIFDGKVTLPKRDTDEQPKDLDDVVDNAVAKSVTLETNNTPEDTPEPAPKEYTITGLKKKKAAKDSDELDMAPTIQSHHNPEYELPPISMLNKSKGKPTVGDIKAAANTIKRTLQNFRIDVEIDEISIGPTVTRFAIKPAEGVKLSRISGLKNELALALAAHPIRIEAPIPGKSLVGIEIPNNTKTMLGMGSLLSEKEFTGSQKSLLAHLGHGVSGKTVTMNIAKMPHILIAGATGAGKSVTVHAIITSLLYRNAPENLRFIMVDPKRVELTLYTGIPHLLTPVIKDPKKAIVALKWAVKEMERRYNVLESESVRDIGSYHENIVKPAYEGRSAEEGDDIDLPEKMPYIVVIIDELADIMQMYPKELEAGIVRLAQMSRAVGIHLILSTQRPEVNVITGLIKANIPARLALRVTSQIDSRTILDSSGAENLLGAGDMLYRGGNMAKPMRVQCGFISETEIKKIVKFLKKNHDHELYDEINLSEVEESSAMFSTSTSGGGSDDEDELYEDARETVIRAGKASTSYLQRKLRVGYARAARLMDMLEENGVIGPAQGSKPRDVLERAPESSPSFEAPQEVSYTEVVEDYEEDSEY